MTAPEADLTGWTASPFSAEGFTYVYRKGEGPAAAWCMDRAGGRSCPNPGWTHPMRT